MAVRYAYFNFKRLSDAYLITNDTGMHLFLSPEEFKTYTSGKVVDGSYLYNLLEKNYFIIADDDSSINEAASQVRKMKGYLFEGTKLHIFVMTNACNQNCFYCQASGKYHPDQRRYMNEEIAKKAVDVALSSPAKHLIFEFQGGEPLLNFETIEYIVHYANEEAKRRDKSLQYNLVSNLTLLTDKMLDFLVCNNIGICTSLDGPEELHNANRPLKGGNSYETLGKWIRKINILYEKSGYDGRVQALQTTTRKSLSHAREIVDEYIQLGIERVFIRPLTPVGYALKNWKHIGYTPEEFLTFYKECFGYIEKQRLHGIRIVEGYAKIFQNRIFGDKNVNFMELRSPCGGAIGQLAYNYDGDIFTCDEGRMIAQTGNKSFKLGDVFNNDYVSLIDNPVARSVCIASCLESIPGCSDCVYSPYCGSCPVVNLVLQNSIFGAMPSNYKCKIYKGILDTIFWRIRDTNVSDVMRV